MRQAMIIGAGFGEVLSACPNFVEEEEAPATLRSPGTDAAPGRLSWADVPQLGETGAGVDSF